MIIQVRGWENFIYAAHLLGEAGVVGQPLGANQFELPDDAEFPDDVAAELAAISDFAGAPPVADDEGRRQLLGSRDHQPLAPAALAPLAQPPRTGPGATRKAWARYAAQQSPPVTVTDGMSRDDIIRAVEADPDDC